MEDKQKNINNHYIALYDKFVIAFSCFLMFFIGAPLGAIIRKGGLGLPIVFAVLVFIIFHFINTFGKKVAQENGISPLLGTWLSSIVLTPLAILLTYRATNDIGLFNIDSILLPFQKLYDKLSGSKKQ
jgi:lipopolysaccharide export system permease protein